MTVVTSAEYGIFYLVTLGFLAVGAVIFIVNFLKR